MRLARMTTRRWMTTTAVVALTMAGLLTGPPRLVALIVACLLLAPLVLIVFVLARGLGWATLFR